MRSRPLRAASTLLLLPLGTAAAIVGVASVASAAPTIPPVVGHNVIVFPQRDFVSATGYSATSSVTVEVHRSIAGNDVLVSSSEPATPSDDPRTPGFDGLVEVNHPGGVCWTSVTPDIRPGDTVVMHEVSADPLADPQVDQSDGTVTANVVVTQPATSAGPGTIEVHGTAADANGAPIDITQLDQRLVANRDAFDANGRRTLRAASVQDDGLLSYDSPGSTHWTAVYTGLTPADVDRAVGAESRILWLGATPATPVESTIYEAGAVGGPTAPCTAPLNAPVATVTPADTLFSATATDTDSAATTLTIANTGAGANADLTVASVASDSPDFVVSGTPCATAIATGASCATQTVVFHPATPGLKTGTLTITSDASNGPQKVTVAGLAVDAAADPAARIVARPASVSFATRLPGTTSPAERVTLTNIGNGSVTPDSVAVEDAALVPNYAVSATTCAAALAPDATCTVDLTFTPTDVGARPAALVVKAGAASLVSVPLSGKGLDVANVNDPPVLPTSILVFSVRDFVSSSGFEATDRVSLEVIRHGVVVGFVPDQIPQDDPLTDAFDGIVEVNHPGGGCWSAPYTPDIRPGDIVRTIVSNQVKPARDGLADQTHVVDVGTVNGGADDGHGHLVIHGWARGTDGRPIPVGQLSQRFVANKQAFVASGRRTLRAGFGGGEGTITYDPIGPDNPDGSNWTATYTLVAADITRALTTSEARIIWLGRDPLALFEGTFYENGQVGGPAPAFCTTPAAPPSPDYEYAPNALTFPTRAVGSTPAASAPKAVVLRNTGTSDLHVQSVALGGADADQFALDGGTTCAAGTVLATGKTCVLSVVFAPSGTPGTRSATIVVTDDVVGPPQTVTLSAVASADAVGFATVSPAELVFPDAALGATSAFQRVTVTNEGQAPLDLAPDAVTFAGTNGSATTHDFGLAPTATPNTCDAPVPPGGTCHVDVVFTGSALNDRADALRIATTPAISVPLAGRVTAVGRINDPPTGGHSILVFPERDFVSAAGYAPDDNVTVQVVRNGRVIGSVDNVVPQDDPTTPNFFDGIVDVNHPGGVCWANNSVPDIRPGDIVRLLPHGLAPGDNPDQPVTTPGDQTHTQGVTVTQAATQTAPGTVVVKGTATDVFTGGRIPIGQLEVRIINKNLFDANGKRTLRAGPGLDGSIAYDTATSKSWTATFANLTAADVQRTIENIDATGKNIGGETRGLWLGRDPLALSELTFFEHGVVGGAVAPCTGALTAAALTSTPASAVFDTQALDTAAPQTLTLTIANVGNLDANLEVPTIVGGNAASDFTILPDSPGKCPVAPKVLEFGAPPPTCTIEVQFLPSARGLRTSTLQLVSDATASPLVVPLSGIAAVPPVLDSLSAVKAAAGTPITLTGSGFLGTDAVSFGASPALFTVVSDTRITATVPAGIVGTVDVTVHNVAGTSAGLPFTTAAPPTVGAFSPTSGSAALKKVADGLAADLTVTVQGTDLDGGGQPDLTKVSFNGVAATVTNVTAGSVTALVPAGATTGRITVTTALGQAVTAGTFTVLATPAVTSITGVNTKPGSSATVNGTGFTVTAAGGAQPSNVLLRRTGTTDLAGTAPARTATTIKFTVPSNAAGPYNVVVRTPVTLGGVGYYLESPVPQVVNAVVSPSLTGACVYATQAAAIAGSCAGTTFAAAAGNWVRLQGSGLYGTTAVQFGGQKATVFGPIGSDPTVQGGVLVAQVPAGSKSGAVQVTAPGGSASANGFTFVAAPTVTTVSPTTVARGGVVTLTGTGFVNSAVANVSVRIFGPSDVTLAANVVSATQLTFTVPGTALPGLYTIQVITVGGTATSPQRVTVT